MAVLGFRTFQTFTPRLSLNNILPCHGQLHLSQQAVMFLFRLTADSCIRTHFRTVVANT